MKRDPFLINNAFNSYIIATILAAVATNLGAVVDGIIVGNLLGGDGLSAVNLSSPLSQFYLTIQLWLSTGIAMLTAAAIGQGDKPLASSYFTLSLLCSVLLGGLLMIVGAVYSLNLSKMLCADPNLLELTNDYVRIMLLTAPLYLLLPGIAVFVRSDGSPKLASLSLIVANIVNIGCDILFMKYFGWGIAGSAWATAVGFIVGIFILTYHFTKKHSSLYLNIDFSRISFKQAFSIGISPAVWSLLMTLRIFSLNHIILSFLGSSAMSVFAVCFNMQRIISLFISGSSQTLQPIGSILIGLGDTTGVKMAINKALITLIQMLVVICLAIFIFPIPITKLFGLTDPTLIEQSVYAVRVVTLSFLFFGFNYLLIIVYQLTKRLKLSLILSTSQVLVILPIIYGLALLNPNTVWWSFLLGEVIIVIALVLYSFYYRNSKQQQTKNLSMLTLLPSNNSDKLLELSLDSRKNNISHLLPEIDSFLKREGIVAETANNVRHCCEELVLNILQFGFEHSSKSHNMVDIRILVQQDCINVSVSDNGKPFNPLNNKQKVGFGLPIVKGLCSKLEYKYIFSQNIVQLTINS